MGGVLSRMTRRRSLGQIRHVTPVWPGDARGLVARVYAQVEREFGMLAPPVALHSPAPAALAACWVMLRETLLASGATDRATKEVVAAAVSLHNACPYCADVHSATLGGLVGGRDAEVIGADQIESVADPGRREIARWARGAGTGPAWAGGPAPFPAGHAPELVGVAVTFHYLNRMVNVFLGESPLPSDAPVAIRRGVWRLFGRVMRPFARRDRDPGRALDLLPTAPLPEDLAWAAGQPIVAEALARAATAVEAAGRRVVPDAVRNLVTTTVARWDGRPTGPSRAWVDDAVAGLPVADRPAGRLALLTALASYQVDAAAVEGFRGGCRDDEALVELASWASLTAARRIGSQLWNTVDTGSLRDAGPTGHPDRATGRRTPG
ncbi:MAG TPA: carboxymuconolactone decarboxylase family protein [Pilimelia sp.]|nr:carboxymuconolactone decarboxylase family protein [Pilimelia sp.]